MCPENNNATKPTDRLLQQLRGKRFLLIVMQDNPDPDSIASAAALRKIANTQSEVQCSITYGGVIGRGENRALADYLGLNFRRRNQVDLSKFDVVALVDSQPNAGNNSLPAEIVPHIVLDHHPLRPETRLAAYSDVRPKYGALSTILVEYLRELGIDPEPSLATALLYAIRTDTQDLGRGAVQADVEAVQALYPRANKRMLSAIQRGSVTAGYFDMLARGLDNARVYGARILTRLGDVENPDMMAELADLLLRHEGVEWVLAYGIHEDKVWMSLRTSQTERRAGDVMRRIVAGMGTGGGHAFSAGGQVVLGPGSGKTRQMLRKRIRERFLRHTTGGSRGRGKRLVRR